MIDAKIELLNAPLLDGIGRLRVACCDACAQRARLAAVAFACNRLDNR